MNYETLSVEKGIEIQTEQLNRWETVLQPKVYEALVKYATETNNTAKSGYDICRGSDLSCYVENYMRGHMM